MVNLARSSIAGIVNVEWMHTTWAPNPAWEYDASQLDIEAGRTPFFSDPDEVRARHHDDNPYNPRL